MTEGIATPSVPADPNRTITTLAWAFAPVGVALLSACLGAVAVGHRSLTAAEATSLSKTDGPLRAFLSSLVRHDPSQAGQLLVLRLARRIGTDEWSLRAPSVVAVALAAGLIVIVGTLLLGRLPGLVAGIALAGNAGVVEASREARPYAFGLLGIVLASLLLVSALERGGGWRWLPYALVAALLPLTHPLAASVLAAHGAGLIARRDRAALRRAGVALLSATVAAGLLLTWMAADRFDAPAAAGPLDLERLARGLAAAVGWNPVLVIGAIAGVVALFLARSEQGPWQAVLVCGLLLAPVATTILAALAVEVFPGALVLCAPGVALATGATVLLLSRDRVLVGAGLAALAVAGLVTVIVQLLAPANEDWRALATAVARVKGPTETVVVVPERGRSAFRYYAPSVPVLRFARGGGAWVVVVAADPTAAVDLARPSVPTPRYALLRQFRYGNGLRLQHWVRP